MTNLRKAFIAAIVKSLLRGKSLIQALLSFWVSPGIAKGGKGNSTKTLQDFLKDAEAALLGPVSGNGLQELSAGLKKQFVERLQIDEQCMLPSYSHQLPLGSECGQYLALDVGGSTLRVAVVELRGRRVDADKQSEIISMHNYRIGKDVKDLEGMDFFNWMGRKIAETLAESGQHENSEAKPLPISCAWSFPIEQTSMGSGKLLPMGKAFLADRGLLGEDLAGIIKRACKQSGLHVELRALLNDSSACLLSRAYSYTSTRFGLILGTGVNLAAYMPVQSVGMKKFGVRPKGWYEEANHVIVNTELGMFGHNILPLTRWDHALTKQHPRPDFQPLEHLVSGMYLGEIVRLALLEAIETTGLLGGVVPHSLRTGYSLGTDTISMIESDISPNLEEAIKIFSDRHPSSYTPTSSDLIAIKALSSFVSIRSSALVATCVYTLWDLRLDFEQQYVDTLHESSLERKRVEDDMKLESTTVAFNGSVIENYPGYLANCQRYLDELIESKSLPQPRSIGLIAAKESSLMGAAVALACVERGD
ncbi:hexokinase family protein [Metarhizium robertsii]|uniref:Phosphotransferase n=2 Tax=Metarhizium robertsii TaxID=568076 RepID=E9EQX3_METRA|nr:hexokinase-1 [Metarhizium robertsii ARSEF 23]EFZ02629.1 hexokinase-1 [Metarhizium robertsii ARSEF 23]EXV05841.1 hexokinase family protein [Metarhizium robertsii]